MKSQLFGAAMLAFAVAAGAQTSAAGSESASAAAQAGHASASAAQATNVSAELTKKIESKDAKPGDPVFAKTTSEAHLSDGTKIPKGSKLLGHVTDVQAKSKENHDGHVAFCFDHAVLKDGREVPVNAMVRLLSAPAEVAPSAGPDDLMASGGMQASSPMTGGGGGGLAANGPGGAVHSAAGLAGGATSTAGSGLHTAGNGIDGAVNGTTTEGGALGAGVRGAGGAALNGSAGVGAGANGAAMPVGNLSGVTFATVHLAADAGTGGTSATGGASTATLVTGHNRNVSLYSGSQMTMSIAPR
ncbi:MAG TPA: hypothetical protein VHE33_07435 [Acidobacteriaceae bacterium]|nr:hypothetical protein [Acidobacteriaceae bacterium]